MSRRTLALITAAVVLCAGVAAVVVYQLQSGVDDPESAACATPAPQRGEERTASDHREVDLTFTCGDATLSGTLYLPNGTTASPAAVWVWGAGEAPRLGWGGDVVPGLVGKGVAVFSFDKRGVGDSEGDCCPGDSGHFNLLTADVEGAVRALRDQPEVRPDEIGLIGASQAGWIAPRAAVESEAAYVALASAPTVPERLSHEYEQLAAEGDLSGDEISRRLAESDATGYDPLPSLEQMTMPGLWMYGTADDFVPVPESIDILRTLKRGGNDVTVRVFPDAGHGLLDIPPTAPAAPPTLIAWVSRQVG